MKTLFFFTVLLASLNAGSQTLSTANKNIAALQKANKVLTDQNAAMQKQINAVSLVANKAAKDQLIKFDPKQFKISFNADSSIISISLYKYTQLQKAAASTAELREKLNEALKKIAVLEGVKAELKEMKSKLKKAGE